MRSVFKKSAKRYFTIGQLLLLVAVLFSLFVPQSGLTFEGVKQIEFAVKKTDQSAALWVTNLGAEDAKLTLGAKPFGSAVTKEKTFTSEAIPRGQTVRLDTALPPKLRGSDTLFIRSREEVATLLAPADFPVNSSEFYSSRPANGQQQEVPKWVRELGAIGKSGNNVFYTDGTAYAPVVKGKGEFDKRYQIGVGVTFTEPKSSAEFKLVNKAGDTIKSVVLSSSAPVNWQGQFGEFVSGNYYYPSRVEMKVLSGTAQGFLSIKEGEAGQPLMLPLAPYAGEPSLEARRRGVVPAADESGLLAHAGRGGPKAEEESSAPAFCVHQGYAWFSNGVFDSRYSSYTYNVQGGPPNVCGTLHINRNGVDQSTGGWLCTDGNGDGSKGPWYGSTDQTGQGIYIEWPNCNTTTGGDYKVDDASDPNIWSNQTPGVGVSIPTEFSGGGSDTQWGSGFNFGSWSYIKATFREIKNIGTVYETSKYYNGSGYVATSPVEIWGTASPPAGGFSINWAVTPPPPGAHNSTDTYEWCVYSNDYFYTCFNCLYFYGPR